MEIAAFVISIVAFIGNIVKYFIIIGALEAIKKAVEEV